MFYCTWAVGCRKFVQYIHMLCPGRFILIESVSSVFSHNYQSSEGKKYLNYLDLRDFFINRNFARFSPCQIGWRKARESLIYQKLCRSKSFDNLKVSKSALIPELHPILNVKRYLRDKRDRKLLIFIKTEFLF